MQMLWYIILGVNLTPLQVLSQLIHNLLRVLILSGVHHCVSSTSYNHADHVLHRLKGIPHRDLVDGEPGHGELVRVVPRLRGHPVRHAVVREQDDVDHVIHIGFSEAIHEVAEILIQTPETLFHLDGERSKFLGLCSEAVFVHLNQINQTCLRKFPRTWKL